MWRSRPNQSFKPTPSARINSGVRHHADFCSNLKMPSFTTQVSVAVTRVLGACYGAFLLVLSPFAFNGALASEVMVAPILAERLLAGFSMAVPGCTLLVPIRAVLLKPAWANALLLAYTASLVLSLLGPLQARSFSAAQAWPALMVALNLAAYLQYRRASNDV